MATISLPLCFTAYRQHHHDAAVQPGGVLPGGPGARGCQHPAPVPAHLRSHRQDQGRREPLQAAHRQALHGGGITALSYLYQL